MQFRLRTLLIVLAVGPLALAVAWPLGSAMMEAREIVELEAAIAKYKRGPSDFRVSQRP